MYTVKIIKLVFLIIKISFPYRILGTLTQRTFLIFKCDFFILKRERFGNKVRVERVFGNNVRVERVFLNKKRYTL